jgi:ribonuclease HI
MIIYMDGGSQRNAFMPGSFILSWGLVAHYTDATYERHGCIGDCPPYLQGSHEKLAFIEAVRFALSLGADPDDITFITDDGSVCDANRMFHKHGNLVRSDATVQKITEICNAYFDKTLKEFCLKFLARARFIKVKGHSKTVYNLRCDHLARHARNWELGDLSPLLPFEEWLHDGFLFYDKKLIKKTWFVPFSEMYFTADYSDEDEVCLEVA